MIFLLKGVAESGFFAGIITYFSLWYCKKQQTMRYAMLVGAAIAAGAIDGVLVRVYKSHER